MRQGATRLLVLLALGMLVTRVDTAYAQDRTAQTVKIVAEACADGTTPASRDAALRAAREEAVWLWLEGTLGEAQSEAFLPLMEYLDTYTASSRMTNARVEAGRTCVEAEVYLYEWPLRTDAATILIRTRREPPRVAFLFVENDQVSRARRFQEQARFAAPLIDAFRAKGFAVIEPATTRSTFGDREFLAMLEAGPAALARYGADVNADAVVSVEATLSTAAMRGGTVGSRADLQAIVVSASDGAILDQAKVAAEVAAADATSGLRFALDDAVYKLRDRAAVAAVLAARGTPDDRFDLTIQGVRDRGVAERIVQGLRGFEGISGADVLAARDGVARIRFQYGGRIARVVDFLESGGTGVTMRAVRVVGHEMHFNLGA